MITVTEVSPETSTDEGKERFFQLLRSLGIDRPRLKVLPLFHIGAEAQRGGEYESWQRLREEDAPEGSWDHLQCSGCRMVTDLGVWVCPILVNEPSAQHGRDPGRRLGELSPGPSGLLDVPRLRRELQDLRWRTS